MLVCQCRRDIPVSSINNLPFQCQLQCWVLPTKCERIYNGGTTTWKLYSKWHFASVEVVTCFTPKSNTMTSWRSRFFCTTWIERHWMICASRRKIHSQLPDTVSVLNGRSIHEFQYIYCKWILRNKTSAHFSRVRVHAQKFNYICSTLMSNCSVQHSNCFYTSWWLVRNT